MWLFPRLLQTSPYCCQLKLHLPSNSPLPEFLNYLYTFKTTKQTNGNTSCHAFSTKTLRSKTQPACQAAFCLSITNTMIPVSVTYLRQPLYIPFVLQVIASIKKTPNIQEVLRSHFFKSCKIPKYPTCSPTQQLYNFSPICRPFWGKYLCILNISEVNQFGSS